jgi:predicted DNA-binding transcriptional regulator YafY
VTDRVERLTNLLALLLETRVPLSAVEIMDQLGGLYPAGESARRGAFERDKATLREIGVPIEQDVGLGEQAGQTRYRIDRRRYELADLDLTDDETRALQVAVATTRLGAGDVDSALWKLGASAVTGDVDVVATVPALPALAELRRAVAERAVVRFRYQGADRDLEPWGIGLRDGRWYVVGRDVDRAAPRTFRVDRIEAGVRVRAAGTVVRPADVDVAALLPGDPKELADGGLATAVVRVDRPRAVAVERELGVDRVRHRGPDGAIDVEVPCGNRPAFRSWLLGLEGHAEVLSPPEVRDEIVAWLRALAGRS